MKTTHKERLRLMLKMARHGWKIPEMAQVLAVSGQAVRNDFQMLSYILGEEPWGKKPPGRPRVTITPELEIINESPHTCKCGGRFSVVDSRAKDTFIHRRRKCETCERRITTVEVTVVI